MMATLRVEKDNVESYSDILTQATEQFTKISRAEEVRWYDLMRILLTWVYWRRPEAERAALLAIVEKAQTSRKRRREIQQMASKLGPSYVDLGVASGVARGVERGLHEVRLQTLRDMLKTLLEDKFSRLPKKLQKQIDAVDDADQLRQAIRRLPKFASLADFQL